jgi:hypothetical protein
MSPFYRFGLAQDAGGGGAELAPELTFGTKDFQSFTYTFTPNAGCFYDVTTNVDRYAQVDYGNLNSGTLTISNLPENYTVKFTLVEFDGPTIRYRNESVTTNPVLDKKVELKVTPWDLSNIAINGNGFITNWYDTSGSGFDFGNATADVNRPQMAPGNNGIRFEQSYTDNKYLVCDTPLGYGEYTYVVAYKPLPFWLHTNATPNSFYRLVDSNRPGGVSTTELAYYTNGDLYTFSGSANTKNYGPKPFLPTFNILTASLGNNSAWLVHNGFPYADDSAPGTLDMNNCLISLGGAYSQTDDYGFYGDIYEFRVYDRKLLTNEIKAIETHLNMRWNKEI